MNFKTFISLLVAASLGLAAVWVGRQLIFGKSIAMPGAAMTKVVVAKNDLDPGQQITLADLSIVDMPSASAPPSAFKDPEKLKDRTVLSAVVKGQVMFDGLLAGEGADGGLMALVPKGMRAVSVEVSESSGLAGLLVPGCRVDVIATLRSDNNDQIAKTIVENAKVQAIGVKMSKKPGEEKFTPAKTVTLIVTTKDAEAIELASNSGRPRLVMRGMSDTDRGAGPGVTFAELSGGPTEVEEPARGVSGWDRFVAGLMNRPIVSNEPLEPVRWPVQIIRGNSESTIFYEVPSQSTELADRSLATSPQPAASSERPKEKK